MNDSLQSAMSFGWFLGESPLPDTKSESKLSFIVEEKNQVLRN